MLDLKNAVGTHDILLVTLDTLRYDVAATLLEQGRTPNLAALLPGNRWEKRHSPASFTYAAHHAFFAGFLPTPPGPGPHPRPFAARFPGSESTVDGTWVFDAPDLVTALRDNGYRTLCLGGVGFFNLRTPLGRVLPSLFDEAYWEPAFGVTAKHCLEAQLARLQAALDATPRDRPVFAFLNVAALHQPNRHYLAGADEDTVESHAAALEYVDAQIPRLVATMTGRGRPCAAILCSDHGTAYGEDGLTGHRVAHDVVWTVPYAEVVLHP
jgi:arylsulfatase A-like enzyme